MHRYDQKSPADDPAGNGFKPESPTATVMLTIAQFGARYQVCRTRVYQLLNRGEIVACKSGRLTLISLDEAEAWSQRLPKYKPGAVVARIHALDAARDGGTNV